ncbi:MAG: T9SS C-terminal target domain-containing protein, partial [Bacteroidetes bacterium]
LNLTVTVLAGDINNDCVINNGEIAGDTNGDGTIGTGEIAGDTNGDGTIDNGETAGDTNGDGTIGTGEVTGDINGNGTIDGNEVEGDANGNGVLDPEEQTTYIQPLNNYLNATIYPNPANNRITVKTNNAIQTIKVLSIDGKLVYQNILPQPSNTTEFKISGWAKGVYYIHITDIQQNTNILKLIKK